jgi:short-subunit dehydrogenase
MKYQNKSYALITGATSGIGYELAKIFAANGYNLIIVARTSTRLEEVAREFSLEFGVNVVAITKNLFSKQTPFELYEEILAKGLQVDVLVNDAGQGLYGRFIDTDIYKELDIIQLNISAYVVLTKLFLRDMIHRQEGKILNVASIASKVPGPYQSVYHGTKAFVHSFTEAIRAEIAHTGVTITSLLPGATATDFFQKANMESSKILDQDLADPADVALDGFNALMNGDDMVVSGFKNKAQVAMSNITPDSSVARQILKQQSPRDAH